MAEPAPRRLSAVPVADLPVYPIDRSERLPELAFVKWVPSRWLQSSGHLKCTYEVQGVARALFDLATSQSPIGTLPDDDEELAQLLRLPQIHWQALRGLGARGPLRNWMPCLSDGEARLFHRVVTEQLLDVLHRRETRELSKAAQAEAKRHERLAEGLIKAGIVEAATRDGILMKRLDDWLLANWRGNRTVIAYLKCIEHGVGQGWFDRSA